MFHAQKKRGAHSLGLMLMPKYYAFSNYAKVRVRSTCYIIGIIVFIMLTNTNLLLSN